MAELYGLLKKLGISYEETEHEAVYTIEQAQRIKRMIDGAGCKNLFLTDRKGGYILAVLQEDKRADLKALAALYGVKKLSFASDEQLSEVLGLTRGSVTPMGLINDKEHAVKLAIDGELRGSKLLFHPNVNTRTISITADDLIKYIEYFGNEYKYF